MSQVDLDVYADGYYGYLNKEVRDTLGAIQDSAGTGGSIPGIESTATGTVMVVTDAGVVADKLGGITVHTQRLETTGTVHHTGLNVFADNAAALTAGLVAGDMYRTATGEVRVVV